MIEENISLDPEELFAELIEQARAQGIGSQEAWDELVDELIDAHLSVGEMDKDEDLAQLQVVLQARYADYSAEL